MAKVRINSKGQVLIPACIRKQLRITPGTPLEVQEENGKIIIERDPSATLAMIDKLSGIAADLPGGSWTQKLVEEHRREVESER